MAFNVFGAHVHHAFQAVAGADGGCCNSVLASACFRNDAGFAHALGQHGLTNDVIDLVRAGVVEVFALEVNLRTAHLTGHAGCVIDR